MSSLLLLSFLISFHCVIFIICKFSPRKVPLRKTKHVKDRLKFVETYERKGMQFGGKVIWSDETKVELNKMKMERRNFLTDN